MQTLQSNEMTTNLFKVASMQSHVSI